MNPFWRNLAITVLVAGAAGTAGGWMGAERRSGYLMNTLPLRQSVHEIVNHELDLDPTQKKSIQEIEDRYYTKRALIRNEVTKGNMELADALMNDMSFGRAAQQAMSHVQEGLAELQKRTVLYVLEMRDVLTPEQQKAYDRKVREALTAAEP